MVVTNIMTCIKVTKENDISGMKGNHSCFILKNIGIETLNLEISI